MLNYSFNKERNQVNQRVNPEIEEKKQNTHFIVVVRNITEEVPRFWYFGEDNFLIAAERERVKYQRQRRLKSIRSQAKRQRLYILPATKQSQHCQSSKH